MTHRCHKRSGYTGMSVIGINMVSAYIGMLRMLINRQCAYTGEHISWN